MRSTCLSLHVNEVECITQILALYAHFKPIYYLGSGGAKACEVIGDGSVVDGVVGAGRTIFLSAKDHR